MDVENLHIPAGRVLHHAPKMRDTRNQVSPLFQGTNTRKPLALQLTCVM